MIITFGKYSGQTLHQIWKVDQSYVKWLAKNCYYKKVKTEAQAFLDNPDKRTTEDRVQEIIENLDSEDEDLIFLRGF